MCLHLPIQVSIVCHDWGSALGFHWAHQHQDRVNGIVFMEALVRSVPSWDHFPEVARNMFQVSCKRLFMVQTKVLDAYIVITQALKVSANLCLTSELLLVTWDLEMSTMSDKILHCHFMRIGQLVNLHMYIFILRYCFIVVNWFCLDTCFYIFNMMNTIYNRCLLPKNFLSLSLLPYHSFHNHHPC